MTKLSTDAIKRVAKDANIDEDFLLAVHEIADCFDCLYRMTFYPTKLEAMFIAAKQKEMGRTK